MRSLFNAAAIARITEFVDEDGVCHTELLLVTGVKVTVDEDYDTFVKRLGQTEQDFV